MHAYAQTNVQLFNQLRSEGYSQKDRERIREAYEFAMRLFTGLFLPSGKTFIDHLVGTASILASLRMPVEVVIAGLIHAAYLHGDFGAIKTGISEEKRRQVRRVVGEEVEDYIARYDRLLLTAQDISSLDGSLDQLGPIDRYVIVMRLANELEHHLDLGGLYFAHGEKQQRGHQRYIVERRGPPLVTLAERLGFSSLARELETVFRNCATVAVPLEPSIRGKSTVAYLVAPNSYRERISVLSRQKLSSAIRLGFTTLRRAKRLCGRVFKFMHNVMQASSRSA
jgi:(p)ppGpp synthase/HD superfamily hydrolase